MDKGVSITKRENDRYVVAFEGPDGKLACEVSVARQTGVSDRRTQHEKDKEAGKKLRRLAEEFSARLALGE